MLRAECARLAFVEYEFVGIEIRNSDECHIPSPVVQPHVSEDIVHLHRSLVDSGTTLLLDVFCEFFAGGTLCIVFCSPDEISTEDN